MKKATIILILTFMANFVYSQNDRQHEVFKIFKAHYNAGNFENIFNSFSTEMQTALPIEKTKQFLSGLKLQAGNIKEEIFLSFENQTFAVYKTTFEKAILTVNISIDENSKINGLYIKPFVEKSKSLIVNSLSDFPVAIAKEIYAHSKDFPNRTQLSVAVISKGKVDYYGVIIENDTLRPADNQDKIFEIGSITKVFTSSVLASLVVDNKLKMSDFVNTYYPITFNNGIKISFLDLANHTSGLPRLPENLDLSNEENPYKSYGENELNEYLTKFLKLENNAGKKYGYSNLGAGLLGHILGLSQKKTFNELLQERIFKKYTMNNSYTSLEGIESKIVKGLDENGQEVSNWEFAVLFGGGGILSTTEDLAKFAQAQFDKKNKALELTRKPTFDINKEMKIGLGWHILKSENDFNLIWHNGGTGGYSSSMVLDVEKKNGIIILSNVSAFNPKMENIDDLCFKLMKITENQ
jgi:CubicO group peptidase (beta-lactamase class C family)